MKKIIVMVGVIMMIAAAKATEVTTVAFNETRVNLPARVRFVQGNDYGFSVEAKDSIVAKSVRCSVKNGVLTLSMGGALKPGETKFDNQSETYFYGVNPTCQVITDENIDDDMLITVIAPQLPKIATSSDYVAVSVNK